MFKISAFGSRHVDENVSILVALRLRLRLLNFAGYTGLFILTFLFDYGIRPLELLGSFMPRQDGLLPPLINTSVTIVFCACLDVLLLQATFWAIARSPLFHDIQPRKTLGPNEQQLASTYLAAYQRGAFSLLSCGLTTDRLFCGIRPKHCLVVAAAMLTIGSIAQYREYWPFHYDEWVYRKAKIDGSSVDELSFDRSPLPDGVSVSLSIACAGAPGAPARAIVMRVLFSSRDGDGSLDRLTFRRADEPYSQSVRPNLVEPAPDQAPDRTIATLTTLTPLEQLDRDRLTTLFDADGAARIAGWRMRRAQAAPDRATAALFERYYRPVLSDAPLLIDASYKQGLAERDASFTIPPVRDRDLALRLFAACAIAYPQPTP